MLVFRTYFGLPCLALITLLAAQAFAQTNQQPLRQAVVEARQRFTADHPTVRFSKNGERVVQVYGSAFSHDSTAKGSAERFRENNAAIFGVDTQDLRIKQIAPGREEQPIMFDRQTGTYRFTLLRYQQHKGDIPVFRSELRTLVRTQDGFPLVLAGSSLHDLGDFAVTPQALASVRPDAAIQSARADAPTLTRFTEPQTHIWAGVDDMVVEPALALVFEGENDVPEKWLFVVDAQTGAILYKEDRILELDVNGNVSGYHTEGTGAEQCGDEVLAPMPYAQVSIGSTEAFADVDGNFEIANSGTSMVEVESSVEGDFFYVTDSASAVSVETQMVTPPGPADIVHNSSNTELIRAEINAYIAANEVRDYVLSAVPDYPVVADQTGFHLNVNEVGGICPGNAQYTGTSLRFCRAGGGYPNTAWSAVAYHEYGHHLVESGGSGQGQYGEGMGDATGILLTDESGTGFGFFGPCDEPLREADNNMQYPCGGEVHTCGTLISACVWDLRNELLATNPDDYREILAGLVLNSIMLHSGSQITPQITIDYLTLDDDDEVIDNGTPHLDEICNAFGAHNMDCPTFSPISFDYPSGRPVLLDPDVDTTVHVVVSDLINVPVQDTGDLHYAINRLPEVVVPMTPTAPNEYDAVLPAADCFDKIRWYVSAEATGVGVVNNPIDAPTSKYLSVVATSTTITADHEFEVDEGWTVGAPDDDATTGNWERADPQSTAAQPGNDHTAAPGTLCWVTGASAGSSLGSNDIDDGKTTLFSPVFDLSGSDAKISFWLWYSNDTGAEPNSDVFLVEISNDAGATWHSAITVGPSGIGTSGGWEYYEFLVTQYILPTDEVQLRFIASDEEPGSLVEAALDDFKIDSYVCSVAGDGDFDGDGDIDLVDFAGMQQCYGQTSVGIECRPADLNGDGDVNEADYDLLDGIVNGPA